MKSIKDISTYIKVRLDLMPWFLKSFAVPALIVSPIMLILVFVPIGNYSINGEQVSHAEFWQRGGGLVIVIALAWLFVMAIGFLTGKKWSRYFVTLPLLYWVCLVEQHMFTSGFSMDLLLTILIYLSLWYWYFFVKKSVREYLIN